MNEKTLNMFKREVDILRSLDHPNIVSFIDFFEDDRTIYIVLELVDGCDLLDYIIKRGGLEEDEARHIGECCTLERTSARTNNTLTLVDQRLAYRKPWLIPTRRV